MMTADPRGLLLCGKYARAPNLLHYCGPEKQHDLSSYVNESKTDEGLLEILQQFETVYPYLLLIASENSIADPFDPRVVDAYWLGNRLVSKVRISSFIKHLDDGLQLKKKLPNKKIPALSHILPTHTDHVLSIFMRTGHHAIAHTLQTMDSCRVSWGRVKNTVHGSWFIETQPLEYRDGKLQLGNMVIKTATNGSSIALRLGDWVSMHWGVVCDVLTTGQLLRLKQYTQRAIAATAYLT